MEDTASARKRKEGSRVEQSKSHKDDLKSLTVEDLHKLLNEVLEQEDYIKAIAIRDEINSRSR